MLGDIEANGSHKIGRVLNKYSEATAQHSQTSSPPTNKVNPDNPFPEWIGLNSIQLHRLKFFDGKLSLYS